MRPNNLYKNQSVEFWANIKLLNQRLGYTIKVSKKNPNGGFVIPSVQQIKTVFESEGLNFSKLIDQNDSFTEFGQLVIDYMIYRGDLLSNSIQPNLMNKESAKETFYTLKNELNPQIPLPYNKQKDEKKDYSYLTGIVNILINENKGDSNCDFDPKELIAKFSLRAQHEQ